MSRLKRTLNHASAQVTRALLLLGFYGMLRAREFLHMQASSLTWRRTKKGEVVIKGRMSDKTHLAVNRSVLVPVSNSWTEAADFLQARVASVKEAARRQPDLPQTILSRPERAAVKQALTEVKSSPGCIRPGGNMFWLQQGISKALIHKQGGWTPNSSVPSQHYTRLNGWAMQQFRKGSAGTTF